MQWIPSEKKEQPEQEPVAWMVYTQDGQSAYVTDNPTDIQELQQSLPLYTTPPQREWVGLTDAEIKSEAKYFCNGWYLENPERLVLLVKTIQAKLKEKNGG